MKTTLAFSNGESRCGRPIPVARTIASLVPILLLCVFAAGVTVAEAVAESPLQLPETLPEGLRIVSPPVPEGFELIDGDMVVPATFEKGTVWEPNIWTNGVVPYHFVVESSTAILEYTSDTIAFASNPPRILSSSGLDNFGAQFFYVGQMIQVSGSVSNDNTGMDLYEIIWVTGDEIRLVASDQIVNEAAGSSVTIAITNSVSPYNQTRMLEAMAEWENAAAVDFVEASGEATYIRIRASTANRATVGMLDPPSSPFVEIWNWNSKMVMCHELAHTLAEKHEQSRPDRDQFVSIDFAAVSQTACGGPCDHNFTATTTGQAYPADPWGAIYDFDSVMHYDQYAFSICPPQLVPDECPTPLPTIICEPAYAEFQDKIGQRSHLSFWDLTTMSYIYAEPDWVFLHAESPTASPSGTFLDPETNLFTAFGDVSAGGKLVILYPDTYSATSGGSFLIDTPMEIEAPTGGVVLQ